jgi:hypothetical protein
MTHHAMARLGSDEWRRTTARIDLKWINLKWINIQLAGGEFEEAQPRIEASGGGLKLAAENGATGLRW